MNHTVCSSRSAAQTFEIFNGAAMNIGSSRAETFSAPIRPSESENFVSRFDHFSNNGGADEPGRSGNKDTHFKPRFGLYSIVSIPQRSHPVWRGRPRAKSIRQRRGFRTGVEQRKFQESAGHSASAEAAMPTPSASVLRAMMQRPCQAHQIARD